MTVTAKLLGLYRVDQQIRGLRSRLDAAESFYATQQGTLNELTAQHKVVAAQLKQLKTAVASDEGEAARIDARINSLREKMNAAKTNKEYSAFLTELASLKTQKDEVEKDELGQMEKIEAIQKSLAEIEAQKAEREKIASKAAAERDARAAEIKDRLAELTAQRVTLAAAVPGDAMKVYNDLIRRVGDEAMSHVEVLDRRNHEWTCGSCQMALPVETINSISVGRLTRCNACGCILFTEEDVVAKTVKTPKKAKKQAAETGSK